MAAPRDTGSRDPAARNARVAVVCAGVIAGMVGLTYASVPLYRLFCQVTGYGGTTQRAEATPIQTGKRTITVRFNADVAKGLDWNFRPEVVSVKVLTGEPRMVNFIAENRSRETLTGTATFNVTPDKAGAYFSKIACFCFEEQTLKPGQKVEMPVQFFVDPSIENDVNATDVSTVTLSYTFFKAADSDAKAKALSDAGATTSTGAGNGTAARAAVN
jgi:cytochrome c oxidase assembly protein subunit 11